MWPAGSSEFERAPTNHDDIGPNPDGWTIFQLDPIPDPPPPPFILTSVDKDTVTTLGGEIITVTGIFPVGAEMAAYLGPIGTGEDPLCYGGSGLAYKVISFDGTTFKFATPPLEVGRVSLTVTFGSYTDGLADVIKVVERSWPSSMFTTRKDHQPWAAVGARRLDLEDPE